MVTKMLNKVSQKDRLISRLKERLGPIMLKMKSGNLVDDWLESSRSQVDDYKVEQSKVIQSQALNEVCINENWIRNAPNVLFFALQRLQYDVAKGKLVKQMGKFTFDKVIYADRMLEANQGRIEGTRLKALECKKQIQALRASLEETNQEAVFNHLLKTTEYLKTAPVTAISKAQLEQTVVALGAVQEALKQQRDTTLASIH